MKNIKQLKKDLAGQIGENAIWDGPLSKEGFPMGMEHQLLHELKHLNNMSSPFAQKFLSKKPFTSDKIKEKDYESMGDEARKLEEKYSADRGDASNESPLNSYASGSGGMKYVSILPHIQKLQKSFTNMAIDSEKKKRQEEQSEKSMFKSDGTLKNEFSSKYTPDEEKSTYNFQNNIGLSDFEKSNKKNPYYKGQ